MTIREVKRQRSTNYPSMDLTWAVEVIQRAYSQGTMNRTALAQLAGHRDDTSGPARSKLAALRHFGLADYEEGNVIITELGKKIAAPMSNEDVSEALRQSFFNVAAFKQMYELCAKEVALAKDVLANTAIRQLGIVAKAAPEFVDIFSRSGARVNLVDPIDEKSLRVLHTPAVTKQAVEQKLGEVTRPDIDVPTKRAGEAQTWNISLTIDSSMDLDKLRGLIKVLKEEL
jgi:hypothetical protein